MEGARPRKKMVIVGDFNVGKSSLLSVMCGKGFPKGEFDYSVYEDVVISVETDGRRLDLALWETYSQEAERTRTLTLPGSNVVVICFAVNNVESYQSVSERWLPEVLHLCSDTIPPLVLVGCQTDQREQRWHGANSGENAQRKEVTAEEGRALAAKIGAVGYLECSSRTMKGVPGLTKFIAKIAMSGELGHPGKHSKGGVCLIS